MIRYPLAVLLESDASSFQTEQHAQKVMPAGVAYACARSQKLRVCDSGQVSPPAARGLPAITAVPSYASRPCGYVVGAALKYAWYGVKHTGACSLQHACCCCCYSAVWLSIKTLGPTQVHRRVVCTRYWVWHGIYQPPTNEVVA